MPTSDSHRAASHAEYKGFYTRESMSRSGGVTVGAGEDALHSPRAFLSSLLRWRHQRVRGLIKALPQRPGPRRSEAESSHSFEILTGKALRPHHHLNLIASSSSTPQPNCNSLHDLADRLDLVPESGRFSKVVHFMIPVWRNEHFRANR